VHVGGLGQIGLPKVDIESVKKPTPITQNQRFGVSNQGGLPPEHSNVRGVGSSIQHPQVVGRKLVGSAVKGHDAADDEET